LKIYNGLVDWARKLVLRVEGVKSFLADLLVIHAYPSSFLGLAWFNIRFKDH